jgi:osmotically-inducible protein OsmY
MDNRASRPAKTDAELKRDVEAELEWDPAVNAARIGIEVSGGVVTLAGHLDSYPEKLAAANAVQRVAGVKGLAIELDVKIPGSARRSDGEIAQAATEALRWSTLVPPDSVQVTVESGWITLSGELDWAYQRLAADTAVRNLVAVKGVLNRIAIKPQASPGGVKSKIEAALQRSAHFDTKAIAVTVEGGTVTLTGSVHSYAERRVVEDAAWSAAGVSTVVDRLTVVD